MPIRTSPKGRTCRQNSEVRLAPEAGADPRLTVDFALESTRSRTLPRVPANPRVRDGELRGIHAVWADPGPWVRADAGQTPVVLPPGTGGPAEVLPAPPPDDPLPEGQVKGTLWVSLRDRCATPDMPVRSQDRQLSGSGRKTGQALPATAWVH